MKNMKQTFGKFSILIPVGLFFLSGALIANNFIPLGDLIKGCLMGAGIGLIILPFLLTKVKRIP